MPDETEKKILQFVRTEADRMQFGKVLIECTVMKGRVTNIQGETKRSMNVNHV